MTFSDLLKVTITERHISRIWYNIELYLLWPTNRKSYKVYRTALFSITLNDPTPNSKVTPFFDAEYLRNGTRYRHSCKEVLIWAYCICLVQELISRLDSRTLLLEPRHRCTSSVLSTCLRNDVLASCLLTKHTPDDVIVTHTLLYDILIGPIFNDLERLDF